jgi:hypothetical protein
MGRPLTKRRAPAEERLFATPKHSTHYSQLFMARFPALRTWFQRLRARWHAFAATARGKQVLKGARYTLTVSIIGYLAYRMTTIGWGEIWASLPRTPWFYVIFFVMYLTLPTFQSIIYGLIFKMPAWSIFPAALKKRVYNKDVMSYSGEVYLYFWARDRVDQPGVEVMHGIKDNAIVSSITSTLVAFGLLTAFFFSGLVVLPSVITQSNALYVVVAVAAAVVLVALGVRFRRSILQLSAGVLLALFGLHLARLIIVQGLQVIQWAVVEPSVPLQAWFTFLAVQIIANSIPFVPSRDLVGVGFAIEVAQATQVPEALIASLMLVHSVMDKTLNLGLFMGVSAWSKDDIVPDPNGVPSSLDAEGETPVRADEAPQGAGQAGP